MYGYHQFNAVDQQEMAYLKIRLHLNLLINPIPNPFCDPVRRLNHISGRGSYTVQYNGPLPYHDQSEVVKNYDHNPCDAKTLSTTDAVSEMEETTTFSRLVTVSNFKMHLVSYI